MRQGMVNEVSSSVRNVFKQEKALVITGLIGFVFAAMAALIIFIQGPTIAPEGNMQDVFSFTAAVGIFTLSIAVIFPTTQWVNQTKKRMRWTFVLIVLYFYVIEFVQNVRGLDPRFSREGGLIDIISGAVFGVSSLFLVFLLIKISVHFMRMSKYGLFHTAIRYALFSVFFANVAGLLMIALQGRFIGASGNFIALHGIGFHALQTLLLLAWLLERSNQTMQMRARMLHVGCLSWTTAILMITVQTFLGRTIFEWSLFPILAMSSLVAWLLVLLFSFIMYARGAGAVVVEKEEDLIM